MSPDPTVIALTEPGGCRVPVVYRDAELLVLDKPSGIPSVPLRADETGTAVNHALAAAPELGRAGGRGGLEPGLLHRLDTTTSGLLAFALTPESYARLSEAWRRREVRKVYRALSFAPEYTPAPACPLLLSWPMIRTEKGRRRMRVLMPDRRVPSGSTRGRELEALTWIEAARDCGLDPTPRGLGPLIKLWDLTVRIETGVMHQIRAHLEAAGFPIQGDPVYTGPSPGEAGAPAGASANLGDAPAPPPARLWLHAWRLELPRGGGGGPDRGAPLTLEAPLPAGWPGQQDFPARSP
ncbi:MAG: RluA family pseudouridine synthase [Bdellovibrionales bacterium]|nr:RluA family pseudouridine synthase [Bdellovibrionales bacterium]